MKRTIFIMKGCAEAHEAEYAEEHEEHEYEHAEEHGEHAHEEHFPGYEEYVEKHGKHFTEALAEKASELMLNADGSKHRWTPAQVKSIIAGMGHKLPQGVTLGDMTYLANMLYADLYPAVFESDSACIKGAVAMASDPDGYDGQTFCRWKTDMKHKGHKFSFKEFV